MLVPMVDQSMVEYRSASVEILQERHTLMQFLQHQDIIHLLSAQDYVDYVMIIYY